MKDYIVQLFFLLEFLTPLATQAIKVTLDGMKAKYNSTFVALFMSVFFSLAICTFVMINNGLAPTLQNCSYVVALIILNWIGSTIGYDKVKELFGK